MKVWENSKKLWKHSPAARAPTAFLALPNFHSCLYNSIETVVEIINRQTSKDRSSTSLVGLTARVVLYLAYKVEKFRSIPPYVDEQPTPVPAGLLPNNWRIT